VKLFTIFCGHRNGFYQGEKIILELEQWTTGGSTKKMGNLCSAFEKKTDDIYGKKYLSAA
jgi:hypothetical protein